jgi:hypothetical protein
MGPTRNIPRMGDIGVAAAGTQETAQWLLVGLIVVVVVGGLLLVLLGFLRDKAQTLSSEARDPKSRRQALGVLVTGTVVIGLIAAAIGATPLLAVAIGAGASIAGVLFLFS